jgi:hypothetical protein
MSLFVEFCTGEGEPRIHQFERTLQPLIKSQYVSSALNKKKTVYYKLKRGEGKKKRKCYDDCIWFNRETDYNNSKPYTPWFLFGSHRSI